MIIFRVVQRLVLRQFSVKNHGNAEFTLITTLSNADPPFFSVNQRRWLHLVYEKNICLAATKLTEGERSA